MSEDGAMQGLSAGDALKVILGGQDEDDQVHAYPEDFERTIRNAPGPPWDYTEVELSETDFPKMDGYTACANYLARQILEWLEKDPSRQFTPVESDYEWRKDELGEPIWYEKPTEIVRGWSTRMKEDGYFPEPDGMYGCTGFQWGWACNAARKIVGLSSVPNPAIMTIGGSDD